MQISGGRQVGRTEGQLCSLPDGAIFLVHSEKMAVYCRHLLKALGRSPNAIRLATPENFCRFEGARTRVFDVDHAYWHAGGSLRRKQQAVDFLELTVSPYA